MKYKGVFLVAGLKKRFDAERYIDLMRLMI